MKTKEQLRKDDLNGLKERNLIKELGVQLEKPLDCNSNNPLSINEVIKLGELAKKLSNNSSKRNIDYFLDGFLSVKKPLTDEYWLSIYMKGIVIPFTKGEDLDVDLLHQFIKNEEIELPFNMPNEEEDVKAFIIIGLALFGAFCVGAIVGGATVYVLTK